MFIGTPKGKNHFHEIFKRSQTDPAWFSLHLPVDATDVFPTDELGEVQQQMSEEEFEQEFMCSFEAAVRGTYYADMLNALPEERIAESVPYNSELPVSAATDLGFTDSTAIWFWQDTPTGPILVDYEEHDQKPMDFYFALFDDKGYNYQDIWLPHDSKAKSFQTGRSTLEQFINRYRDEDVDIRLAPKLSRQDGINAVRFLLPKCSFRLPHTYVGLEALRNYKRAYNEITKAYSDSPKHDWTSHGADAFRYFSLVAREQYKKTKGEDSTGETPPLIKPAEYKLDDLWSEHDRIINMAGSRI